MLGKLFFFKVLENPSNQSMIHHYENLAKNHMDQYLDILLKNSPSDSPKDNSNLIGSRSKSLQNMKVAKKGTTVPQQFALNFFQTLITSFRNYKKFCKNDFTPECAIFDQDDAVLANALKDYDHILRNHF